jgi:protein-S-isoprenylcysteine O-methyltransferase Ste14
MNEEDPELREKLWDEYREYKAAAKKKGSSAE